jgi:hypothetical protein
MVKMCSKPILYTIVAILSLAVIVLAVYVGMYMKNPIKEGLCSCRGPGVMQHVNREEQMKMYNNGRTEYSDFGSPPRYLYDATNPPYGLGENRA